MAAVAAGVFLVVTAFAPLGAGATQGTPDHKITLCHATDSRTNPYVEVTVDVASVQFQGHAGHDGPIFTPDLPQHTKWGDIIPPFDFGAAGSYPGKNWTAAGQEILEHDCNVDPDDCDEGAAEALAKSSATDDDDGCGTTTTTVAPTTTTVAPTTTTVAPTTTTAAPTTTTAAPTTTTAAPTTTTAAPTTTTTEPQTSTTIGNETTTTLEPTTTTTAPATSTTVGGETSTSEPTTETTEGGTSSTTVAASSTTVAPGGPVTTQANGSTTTTSPPTGTLPFTGGHTTRLALAGLALIGAGLGLVVRRRRPRTVG